jgi:heptosyltransferase-1
MRVLLIKMSSLGDVVHALAPITDASRAHPQIKFDWVVEEAYQDIPQWHPAVNRVILASLRRWRKSPLRAFSSGEWRNFKNELRREQYDLVLDAQGLLKSAIVARKTGAPIVGRSRASIREPLASLFYQRKIHIDLRLTEVEQLRQLFAHALGYLQPTTPADFGLDRAQFQTTTPSPYAMFLHGAAWPSKLWPDDRWIAIGKHIRFAGLNILLPWGSEAERHRAQNLASAIGGTVLPKQSIPDLAKTLANASFVIGLDTGLTHIAVALRVPTVTLYGPSIPVYSTVAGGTLLNLTSTNSQTVDTSRPNTIPTETVLHAITPWLQS